MHAKTRPEPAASLAPPAPDWSSDTRSTIDQSTVIMAKKIVTSETEVGAEQQELKPDPAQSNIANPEAYDDSDNSTYRGCPSWIQQLEQGIADYENFIRWVKEDPSRVYYTIVSAQAEYKKLHEQTVEQTNNALEAHRARAVTEAAETQHSAEIAQAEWDILKIQYYSAVGEASDSACEPRRLQANEPTRVHPEVLASIENPDRIGSNQYSFPAASVGEDVEPRISKSTRLADPEKLDDGVNPPFESWLLDMQGKLFFNPDHYPTEKHRIIYVTSRTTGPAHLHLNARLRQDAVLPYNTVQDMFDDLEFRFGDLNYATEACGCLDRPNMKPKDDFHTFLCKFLYRSGGSREPFELLKHELHARLTKELKRAVMPEYLYKGVTFDEFTKRCGQESSRLQRECRKNNRKNWKRGGNTPPRPDKPSSNVVETPPAPGADEW